MASARFNQEIEPEHAQGSIRRVGRAANNGRRTVVLSRVVHSRWWPIRELLGFIASGRTPTTPVVSWESFRKNMKLLTRRCRYRE